MTSNAGNSRRPEIFMLRMNEELLANLREAKNASIKVKRDKSSCILGLSGGTTYNIRLSQVDENVPLICKLGEGPRVHDVVGPVTKRGAVLKSTPSTQTNNRSRNRQFTSASPNLSRSAPAASSLRPPHHVKDEKSSPSASSRLRNDNLKPVQAGIAGGRVLQATDQDLAGEDKRSYRGISSWADQSIPLRRRLIQFLAEKRRPKSTIIKRLGTAPDKLIQVLSQVSTRLGDFYELKPELYSRVCVHEWGLFDAAVKKAVSEKIAKVGAKLNGERPPRRSEPHTVPGQRGNNYLPANGHLAGASRQQPSGSASKRPTTDTHEMRSSPAKVMSTSLKGDLNRPSPNPPQAQTHFSNTESTRSSPTIPLTTQLSSQVASSVAAALGASTQGHKPASSTSLRDVLSKTTSPLSQAPTTPGSGSPKSWQSGGSSLREQMSDKTNRQGTRKEQFSSNESLVHDRHDIPEPRMLGDSFNYDALPDAHDEEMMNEFDTSHPPTPPSQPYTGSEDMMEELGENPIHDCQDDTTLTNENDLDSEDHMRDSGADAHDEQESLEDPYEYWQEIYDEFVTLHNRLLEFRTENLSQISTVEGAAQQLHTEGEHFDEPAEKEARTLIDRVYEELGGNTMASWKIRYLELRDELDRLRAQADAGVI